MVLEVKVEKMGVDDTIRDEGSIPTISRSLNVGVALRRFESDVVPLSGHNVNKLLCDMS